MTQSTDLVLGAGISGITQRTEINTLLTAIATNHSGASRPSYILTDMTWTKEVSGTVRELYFYDGAQDILLGTIDTAANTFVPAGSSSSFGKAVETKTAAYTMVDADIGKVFLCDATSAAFTLSIAATAGLAAGWFVIIQKIDSTINEVTVDPNGTDTIQGSTTKFLNRAFDWMIVIKASATSFVMITDPLRIAVQTLTDAATVAWDMSKGQAAVLTLTSGIGTTRVLGAPTNGRPGSYMLTVIQGDGTLRNLTYNAAYVQLGGVAPTFVVGSGKRFNLNFYTRDGTTFDVTYAGPYG